MTREEQILQNAKKNSIGVDKKERLIMKTKEISKKVLAAILVVVMAVSLSACGPSRDYVDGYAQLELDVYSVSQELENYGIEYTYNEDKEKNTIETYEQIESLSEEQLLAYYTLLGENECEKVVMALGYEGWDDYLTKNNYVDEKGNPDIYEWSYEAQEELGKKYEQSFEDVGEKSK